METNEQKRIDTLKLKLKVPDVVLEYFELAGQIEVTATGKAFYFLPIVIDRNGVIVTPSDEIKK